MWGALWEGAEMPECGVGRAKRKEEGVGFGLCLG